MVSEYLDLEFAESCTKTTIVTRRAKDDMQIILSIYAVFVFGNCKDLVSADSNFRGRMTMTYWRILILAVTIYPGFDINLYQFCLNFLYIKLYIVVSH